MIDLPVFFLPFVLFIREIHIRDGTILAPCRADMQVIAKRLQKCNVIERSVIGCQDLSGQTVKHKTVRCFLNLLHRSFRFLRLFCRHRFRLQFFLTDEFHIHQHITLRHHKINSFVVALGVVHQIGNLLIDILAQIDSQSIKNLPGLGLYDKCHHGVFLDGQPYFRIILAFQITLREFETSAGRLIDQHLMLCCLLHRHLRFLLCEE